MLVYRCTYRPDFKGVHSHLECKNQFTSGNIPLCNMQHPATLCPKYAVAFKLVEHKEPKKGGF